MGEANIKKALNGSSLGGVPIIGGGLSPRAPSKAQVDAMEAKAVQFADALLAEGMALDAPDRRLMVRLLTLRAASKVVARISREEKIIPSVEVKRQAQAWPQAVMMALQDEIAAGQRLAQAIAKGTEGGP